MARRLFNGRRFSENGWPYVDQGSCQWVRIPGANASLQIQEGPPLIIMRAFAADYNAFIEPVYDHDSACWTPDNSVATSNHPGGTAMDLRWQTHPFQVRGTFNATQMQVINELLDFYEGMIFWGGRWTSPIDEMHWQMGYNTYDQAADKPFPKVFDFINRKIRPDGLSTFRRGGEVNKAQILADATGLTIARANEIVEIVSDGLLASDCTNVNRIAMWLAQVGHESGSFKYTEEIQSGDESTDRWKYKGRTWIQITWSYNYAGFSQWCFDRGLVPSPTYFVDRPKELAHPKWAALGPAWYWTVARPQINPMSDARDLEGVTRAINGGLNGIDDRRSRYNRALAVGDRLLALIQSGDDMAHVPQEQWDWVYNELRKLFPHMSMYSDPTADRDTLAGRVIRAHAFGWDDRVESSALRGEQWAIGRVVAAAKGLSKGVLRPDGTPDPFLVEHADAVLHEIAQKNPDALKNWIDSQENK